MIDRVHKLPIKHQAEVLSIRRADVLQAAPGLGTRPAIDAEAGRTAPELPVRGQPDVARSAAPARRRRGTSAHRHADEEDGHLPSTIYRKRNTSKLAPGHRIYPYLLRDVAVTRSNQAWAMDISYIPMARGFAYFAAVVDRFSRKILSWKLSITMDVSFCLEALEEALSRNEKPEIFNTDQRSQFTSEAFTEQLKKNGIQTSMDGKGCWRDNVFVERIWRTIKYEGVYFRAYESVHEARTSLGKYIAFYDRTRPHSSLKEKTPHQVHLKRLPETLAA